MGWSQSRQGSVTFSCEDKLFQKKKNNKEAKERQGDTAAPNCRNSAFLNVHHFLSVPPFDWLASHLFSAHKLNLIKDFLIGS